MKFGIIDPRTTRVEFVDAADLTAAKTEAGLDPDAVDHGTLWRDFRVGGVAIVVYEFSLFVPPERQRYFAIMNQLYAGPAVLYGFDAAGETIDLPELPPVFFFRDAGEVERAIAARQVERPETSVNGVVYWSWPEPPDAEIAARMKP